MLQSEVVVFITASDDTAKLKRAIDSAKLSFSNIRVNINSLDSNFIDNARVLCDTEGVTHYTTESNGYPAKGKNATFDLFKDLDYEYLFMLDGDDYLAHNTFRITSESVELENPHVLVFQNGKVEFSGLDSRINPIDRLEMLHEDAYSVNKRMYGKLFNGGYNQGRGIRVVLYRKGVVTSEMARMDESLQGMEDMQSFLKLLHLHNTEKLKITRIFCPDFYIYDLGEGFGDYLTALFQKPEVYSQNMVNYWKSLEGVRLESSAWDSVLDYWNM